MKNISDLITRLNTLPKGYLSKKKIKGKIYFYHQYLENGKIVSHYIPSNKVEEFKNNINERKRIEKELRNYRRNNNFRLSNRSLSLSGYIMMSDEIVAKYNNGNLVYLNEKKAPLYIVRTKNIEEYFRSRTIDLTRPNARILLKFLNIQNKESIISLYAHGATITDNYWFKPLGSKLKYKDVSFNSDAFADLALKGQIPQLRALGSPSPEITSIGSFEKCWKIINNEWWLFKAGSEDNIYSELFSAGFAKLINIPSAIYQYDNGYIRTKNFADKYNFEPMYSICGENESYLFVFNKLFNIDKEIAKSYIALLIFDAIVYNVDRHNQNYGLLRDKKSGKIISLAPNFDDNMALLSYNKELKNDIKKDQLIKILLDFVKSSEETIKLFKQINLPNLKEKDINVILKNIPIKRDNKLVVSFILSRLNYIKSIQVNL